jgi:nucleoside-diphosphate-sugar epimerase
MDIKSVFVTGISGYIGGTIAIKLRDRNYKVFGLVRQDTDEDQVRAAGIIPVRGDLRDRDAIASAVTSCDAVIHTAESDDPVVAEMFLALLRGTGKTFIYTSGSAIVSNWTDPKTAEFVFTEDFPLKDRPLFENRISINNAVLSSSIEGVRSIVIVPSMVYGVGLLLNQESKQIPMLIKTAEEKGFAVYVNDGRHSWSNIHVEDLADLYVAALEKAKPGSYFFAENGLASFKQIAEAIHKKLGFDGQPVSLSPSEAVACWGEIMATVALGSNCRLNADKARLFLEWRPKHASVFPFI